METKIADLNLSLLLGLYNDHVSRGQCQKEVSGWRGDSLQVTLWEDIGQYVLVALKVQILKAGGWICMHVASQHAILWFMENEWFIELEREDISTTIFLASA